MKIKKTLLILIGLLAIFSTTVKAMNEEEKQSLGIIDNPLYIEYQKLSEKEKQNYSSIPSPYLYTNKLIVNENEYYKPENQIAFFRARQVMPTKYSLTQDIQVPGKNQKDLDICWAMTVYRMLETNLAIQGKGYYDFSELHLDYMTSTIYGGERKLHDGGNFNNFVDYYNNRLGPVYEESLPLQTSVTAQNKQETAETIEKVKGQIKENGLEADRVKSKVTNITVQYFESFDITNQTESAITAYQNEMKTFIQSNGALEVYLFYNDFLECYSDKNVAFLSTKVEGLPAYGHAINIIGWDDTFPKENFTGTYKPAKDGAWIATNSWGEDWGKNGLFYISYEDYFLYQYIVGIVEAEVVAEQLEISIVNLSSTWQDDWKTEEQTIVITGVTPDETTTIKNIKVNGIEQQIQNNTALYEITEAGEYEIEITDNKGNTTSKIYTVNKTDIQESEIEESVVLGDINQDNKIDLTDVLKAMRYIATQKDNRINEKYPEWNLSAESSSLIDVNQDGSINMTDILKILRHISATKSESVKEKHPDWIIL